MNTDELFEFEECGKGYILKTYLLKDEPSVTEVEIPSEYKGMPVKAIGSFAFGTCYLRKVKISEGIEEIGKYAFSSCKELKTVILSDSLRVIEEFAFSHCSNLENIVFPDSLKVIEGYAFNCCGFHTLTFPSGLEKIGLRAFAECEKLKKIDFQNGSPVMGNQAFASCQKLSAENALQALSCSLDITKPFFPGNTLFEYFDWNLALREDVFLLELKYNSFALMNKERIFKVIVWRNSGSLLPLAENAGWEITEKCLEELLDISLEGGFTEITAWLLDYKNRKAGFEK